MNSKGRGQVLLAVALVSLIGLFFVTTVDGHVCLMDPPQRGGFNVSDPGDFSCFKPKGPCGQIAPSNPTAILEGGRGYPIFLQQNLNHYNPGWPGFIDVAWAQGANPPSSAFQTLATIPDYWPHLQAQQTNFSIVVTLPNIDCPHCTLRVRYNPNKPTEPIFHNCADISIVKSSSPSSFGRLFGLAQYGNYENSYLVEIGLDGSLTKLAGPSPVRLSSPDVSFVGFVNGLIAVDQNRQLLYLLGYNSSDTITADSKPSTYVSYDIKNKQFNQAVTVVSPTPNSQWVALVSNFGGQTFPAFLLELVQETSGFRFQARSLGYYGQISAPIGTFPIDDTFVNYFWSEFDHVRSQLYVLSGDENSLFELNVRLYVLNTKTGQLSYVSVDNSQYTVTSIHVDTTTGNIYALSPGLYPQVKPVWSLVQINPTNGQVTLVGSLNSNILGDYYGGGVYGGASVIDGPAILHQFKKSNTGATVLGIVDVATGKLRSSTTFNTGVNNAISLNTVTYVPSQ